jgi:hypothetical protein
MTKEELLEIGFKEADNVNLVKYNLGRKRYLSIMNVDTINETLSIYETDGRNVTSDIICLHKNKHNNKLTIEKIKTLIDIING